MPSIQNKKLILTASNQLRLFIRDVGLPLSTVPKAIGLKSSDFMEWWAGRNEKLVTYQQLVSLGQYLNINEDSILDQSYDKNFIRSVLFSDSIVLPEKYSKNSFSCLRTSVHIQKYLTLTRGQHFCDKIMRSLNVSPLVYSNLEDKISLNYFIDLLDILSENSISPEELDSLACVVFLGIGSTQLGEQFKKTKNYYECYELLANSAHLFDSNFLYTVDISPKEVVIDAYLPFDRHDHILWPKVKMEKLFRYRQLLMGWFPFLANLAPILPECKIVYTSNGVSTRDKINIPTEQTKQIFLLS